MTEQQRTAFELSPAGSAAEDGLRSGPSSHTEGLAARGTLRTFRRGKRERQDDDELGHPDWTKHKANP